ncbi:MAG: hypothetical protein RQ922_00525 [Thermoproteota archaeon]|jgi:hypothetical protein|nr:hypothetical protein [Thermoproteota archaeon]
MRESYSLFGKVLIIFGIIVSFFFYVFYGNIPLTAIGIGAIIIGIAAIMLPEEPTPPATIRSLIESSALTIEAILEELKIESKAIYLPPNEGYASVILPIKTIESLPIEEIDKRNVFLLVRNIPVIKFYPPGCTIVKNILNYDFSLSEALEKVLVDMTEFCSKVIAVETAENIIIEITKPNTKEKLPQFSKCLGSLPASLAALTVVTMKKTPVRIVKEEVQKDKIYIHLRLLY